MLLPNSGHDARSTNKTSHVRDTIRSLAKRLGPGAQLPTLRALCAEYGVSLSTLNSAMAALEAEGVLHRQHGRGIFTTEDLGQVRVALVCASSLFCDGGGSPTWSMFVRSAFQAAETGNVRIHFYFTRPDESRLNPEEAAGALPGSLRRSLADQGYSAVIAIGVPMPAVLWMEAQGVPVITFAGGEGISFSWHYQTAIRMGVRALVEQGVTHIGLVNAPFWSGNEVFQEEILRNGIHPLPYQLAAVPNSRQLGSFTRHGYAAAADWRQNGWAPTRNEGLLILDDMVAQGILMCLGRDDLVPDRNISIASLAIENSATLLGWQDRITRLEFSPDRTMELMLRAAVPKLTSPSNLPLLNEATFRQGDPGEAHWVMLPRLISIAKG